MAVKEKKTKINHTKQNSLVHSYVKILKLYGENRAHFTDKVVFSVSLYK